MRNLAKHLSVRDVVVLLGLALYGFGRYLESPARMCVELGAIFLAIGLFKYAADGVARMARKG